MGGPLLATKTGPGRGRFWQPKVVRGTTFGPDHFWRDRTYHTQFPVLNSACQSLRQRTGSHTFPIDLYPLLRNYDVWGEIVGINWNTKRWRGEANRARKRQFSGAQQLQTRTKPAETVAR